ncbi:MAG: threonine aldolase [Burkholderiales bacterium]|nr:threonine aldolase [Burkholderiales bacterium]
MAQWCEANQINYDIYGEGEVVQAFERKIADLLGYESGLFVMSGTLAQITALRLASRERGRPLVGLHATAHVLKHERSNFQLFDHFKAINIGDANRPWLAADLDAVVDDLGAVLYELPMREIGGQMPDWEALEAIKAACRARKTHLHLDGARLWEAAVGYGRRLDEVTAGFDSTYVSLYKGVGGLAGAVLLGSKSFIDLARVWVARQGGNLFRRTPYVVSAAMQFDARLARLPDCLRRTQWLYEQLVDFPLLTPNPVRPQVNMLHIHMPVSAERATEIRNQIAQQHGIWLFGGANSAAQQGRCYVEWYVGDSLLDMPDELVRDALAKWHAALASVSR